MNYHKSTDPSTAKPHLVWRNKAFLLKNRFRHEVRASVALPNYCGTAQKVASKPKSPKCSDLLRQLKTTRRFMSLYFCGKTGFVQLFVQSNSFFCFRNRFRGFHFHFPARGKVMFFHIAPKPKMTLTPARFLSLVVFPIFLTFSYNARVCLASTFFSKFNKLVEIL